MNRDEKPTPRAGESWRSRRDLPRILNDRGLLGTGVEVGVQRGVHAAELRRGWNGELLVCVDPWVRYPGCADEQPTHDRYMAEAEAALRATDRAHLVRRTTSWSAAAGYALDGARFDFVYLDGDHSREAVETDIAAWWPLVRPGGILAGHDYVPDGWHRNDDPEHAFATEAGAGVGNCGPFGVVGAVQAFVGAWDLPLYLTSPTEDGGWRSWMTVKPLGATSPTSPP
jgi:hypothetical protein